VIDADDGRGDILKDERSLRELRWSIVDVGGQLSMQLTFEREGRTMIERRRCG